MAQFHNLYQFWCTCLISVKMAKSQTVQSNNHLANGPSFSRINEREWVEVDEMDHLNPLMLMVKTLDKILAVEQSKCKSRKMKRISKQKEEDVLEIKIVRQKMLKQNGTWMKSKKYKKLIMKRTFWSSLKKSETFSIYKQWWL